MRPALAALAEQQKIIDRLVAEGSALKTVAKNQSAAIAQLSRGLEAVARLTGNESKVVTAIYKRADEQNPAQPIPDPAGEAPTQTTQEAESPEAKADVRAPGLVPGTNNDTAADAVSTAYTPGVDIDSPALRQLVDVTRPIDGTQGPRPLSETKTLVDVRVGDPMKAQVAFPVNGPFSESQRTSSVETGERTYASLRLARLRIQANMADSDDDLVESQLISKDATLSNEMIAHEINQLEKVTKAASRNDDAPRNLVPRSASVRTVPQLSKSARSASFEGAEDAEDIFLGDI